ncbi:hypothetical protein EJB05_05476 [Eragrostis curvula]|uniref:Uncharacterized protein n=1 Tax=Eragrostis curvula TaxID=38414 RepID=A0A5J9WDC2_9POAL|nr:hypothetical protein EJB05_05476 [Eragrostis curvula]
MDDEPEPNTPADVTRWNSEEYYAVPILQQNPSNSSLWPDTTFNPMNGVQGYAMSSHQFSILVILLLV